MRDAATAADAATDAATDSRHLVAFHMDEFEDEMLMQYGFTSAMMAGAAAGISEHVCMFPVDTIKTRLQVAGRGGQPRYAGVFDAVATIVRREGAARLYRGVSAIVAAAGPSHAVHFATYELVNDALGGSEPGYHPAAHAVAGACGVAAHDAIVTPLDVVKQRMQVAHTGVTASPGAAACARAIVRQEGVRALYASYPTTLVMNAPFMAAHFAVYEGLKTALDTQHDVAANLLAGAGAGGVGALVSTPLDVVKTVIQVEGDRRGARAVLASVYARSGVAGLFRGVTARMLYHMPSSAICWGTYEAMKRWLKRTSE